MHEEALVRDLLRKATEVATASGASRVTGLTVWVGALAHLTEDQFRARFAMAARRSPVEGARLTVQRSDDVGDPRAQGIVLVNIEVDPSSGPSTGTNSPTP